MRNAQPMHIPDDNTSQNLGDKYLHGVDDIRVLNVDSAGETERYVDSEYVRRKPRVERTATHPLPETGE